MSPGVPQFPTGLPPTGLTPTAPAFPGLTLGALTNPGAVLGTPGINMGGVIMDDTNIITMEDDDLQEDIANESGKFGRPLT